MYDLQAYVTHVSTPHLCLCWFLPVSAHPPQQTPALMTLLSSTCANCHVPFARDSPQQLGPLYMFVAGASLCGLSVCWMLDVSDHMNFLIGDNKVYLEHLLMELLLRAVSIFLCGLLVILAPFSSFQGNHLLMIRIELCRFWMN